MKELYRFLVKIGLDPLAFLYFIIGMPVFIRDLYKFRKLSPNKKEFPIGKLYPIMMNKSSNSGTMKGAYFHHDLWAARHIYNSKPVRHVDIGSRIDGFVAHVAVFREIEVFDIRKQTSSVKNIVFKQADFMQLPDNLTEYCDSISSMNAIEHFGLGRYSDPIDPNGHLKGIRNITTMLKPGGTFYFSVPLGKQRVEFNAHRVFDLTYLLDLFDANFTVESFSYVDDQGDFKENVELESESIRNNYGCWFGFAVLKLKKKLVID
ncbi:MAG: DUF268 domain-containing protein [Bacteroidota bacterium]